MPKFLEWNDDFATGIAAIDRDHQDLFRAVNALHESHVTGKEAISFADLFAVLVDYVDGHFSREEDVMGSFGYPDLDNHIISHRELAATVHRMAELYRIDPGAISRDEVLEFLKNWLTKHVLRSDMDYVPYLGRRDGEDTGA